jgi:hypothetical protein
MPVPLHSERVRRWHGTLKMNTETKNQNATEERITYIYTLSCPETGDVMYVGKANDVISRLHSHLKNPCSGRMKRWLASLPTGIKPVVSVVEKCVMSVWEERERFWISHFLANGKLLNLRSGGNGLSEHSADINAVISACAKAMWKSPGFKEAWVSKIKKVLNKPEVKAARSEMMKIKMNKPEAKAAVSARSKMYWKSPGARKARSEKMKNAWKIPQYRKAQSDRMKVFMSTPKAKAEASKRAKNSLATPDARAAHSARLKIVFSQSKYKNAISARMKIATSTPEGRAAQAAKANKRWDAWRARRAAASAQACLSLEYRTDNPFATE